MPRHRVWRPPVDSKGVAIHTKQMVRVAAPTQHDLWPEAFEGMVIRIENTFKVTVSDMKGHAYDVSVERISII